MKPNILPTTTLKNIVHGTSKLKSNTPQKDPEQLPKWSDKFLKKLNQDNYFPQRPKSETEERAIIYNFFQFYFDGTIPAGTSVLDLFFSIVILVPTEDGSSDMFPKSYYSKKSTTKDLIFQIPNYTTPNPVTKFKVNKLPRIKFPPRVNNPCLDQRFTKYKHADQKNFVNEIMQDFLKVGKPFLKIKRAAGFLALTLLRSVIKNKISMYHTMSKTKFQESFYNFTGFKTYCVPSDKPLARLSKTMYIKKSANYTKKFQQMFTKIVSLYVQLVDEKSSELHFLRAAILCHFEYFGLEILRFYEKTMSLFSTAAQLFVHKNILESLTKFPCTVVSWQNINKFLKDYKTQPISIRWSRILCLKYFEELDSMNNFELCGMLSIFVNVYDGYNEIKDKSPKGALRSNFMKEEYLKDYVNYHKEALLQEMYSKSKLLSVYAQTPEHKISKFIVNQPGFRNDNVTLKIKQLASFKMQKTNTHWVNDWVFFKLAQMESAIVFGRALYFKLTNGKGVMQIQRSIIVRRKSKPKTE